ncbi:MAG: hypothetical protein AMS27_12890 [Bacteroides sp. SM23_62_1]|nr:MAG: hypothetical protein AMS27_12890 [Bacteroides sp. SM23_62_1]
MNRILKYSIFTFFALAVVFGGYQFFAIFHKVYGTNVETGDAKFKDIIIPTGSFYEDIQDILFSKNMIRDTSSFIWVAEKKNYTRHVHPGRYRIVDGMNNNQLINMLRSGQQEPVDLVINNMRTFGKLAAVVSNQIEADSAEIMNLLKDRDYLSKLGFTPETAPVIFIPNTYEFYWNTDADGFMKRMKQEYERFWNKDRLEKAEEIGLSPIEVTILASIVEQETDKKEEEKIIAGVYINRLRKNMRLEACPTVKFAVGDMNMTRILDKYLEIDSPYNTYRHTGLPPGPITIPSISSVEAVLNYEKHDYLFFAAKDDLSGYHNFAKTYAQHIKNAHSYQKALDRRKILN